MIRVKEIERKFLIAIIVILLIVFLYMILPLFNIIIFSFILAFFLDPLHEFLISKFKNRKLSSLIAVICVVLGAFLPLLIIFHFVLFNIIEYLTNYLRDGEGFSSAMSSLSQFLSVFLSSSFVETFLNTLNVKEFLNRNVSSLIGIINDFLSIYLHVIVGLFIILFLSYYFLNHKHEIKKFLFSYVPIRKEKLQHILDSIALNLKILFKGYFLTGLAQTFVAFIGYVAFGVPHVLVLTFLTFLTTLIPYVGTLFVWLPIAIYFIVVGRQFEGIGLIVYGTLIVSTIDNFLRPILMSNKKTLPPVLVFLGVIGGTLTFGVPGIILGPLIIAICMTFIPLINLDEREGK